MQNDNPKTITFVSDRDWPGMTHGYQTSLALIDDEVDGVVTGHMSLMDRAKVRYDRIVVIGGSGRVTLDRDGDTWDSHGATDRTLRTTDGFYQMWVAGRLRGEPMDEPEERERPTELTGTAQELEYLAHRFFLTARNYVMGWHSEEVDGELVASETREGALDAFDRSLWRMTIEPLDMMAPKPARDALAVRCSVARAAFEVADMIAEPSVK